MKVKKFDFGLSLERSWLVQSLYERANETRTRAHLVLAGVIGLIIGGLATIYLAGDLVSQEASSTTRFTQIQTLANKYETRLVQIDDQIQSTTGEIEEIIYGAIILRRNLFIFNGMESPLLNEVITRHTGKDISEIPLMSENITPQSDGLLISDPDDKVSKITRSFRMRLVILNSLHERRLTILSALKTLEEKLTSDIDNYLVEGETREADRALLVASAATRFGILLVVIFLVQILVGVYRYSMRLSSFYSSRADALIAIKDRKSDLGGWGDDFLPKEIDFGKHPVSPPEHIVNGIKAFRPNSSKGEKSTPNGEN